MEDENENQFELRVNVAEDPSDEIGDFIIDDHILSRGKTQSIFFVWILRDRNDKRCQKICRALFETCKWVDRGQEAHQTIKFHFDHLEKQQTLDLVGDLARSTRAILLVRSFRHFESGFMNEITSRQWIACVGRNRLWMENENRCRVFFMNENELKVERGIGRGD